MQHITNIKHHFVWIIHYGQIVNTLFLPSFCFTQWLYIGLITERPLPWLLVRQLVTCEHLTLVAKVTVSVVSTTVRLTVERSFDLAAVGRTMMEASLAWPDSFRRGLDT